MGCSQGAQSPFEAHGFQQAPRSEFPGTGMPPGTWTPPFHPGRNEPKSSNTSQSPDRRREHGRKRRRTHPPASKDAEGLLGSLGREAFLEFLESALRLISPDDFHTLWGKLPHGHQVVAWRPPPDVVTDVESLQEHERAPMRMKINDIRRERCKLLSTPKQQAHWDNEGWVITPMSRQCNTHFWQLFRLLPLATTDATKWKATLRYLKDCPEKGNNLKADHHLSIDSNARVESPSDEPGGGAQDSRRPRDSTAPGLDRLRSLAAQSPRKQASRKAGDGGAPEAEGSDFDKWLCDRVEVDTERLTTDNLEISRSHRFSKRTKPSEALARMPHISVMGEAYQCVYQLYSRKLTRLVGSIRGTSKEGKALNALCDTLNIERNLKDSDLPKLFARLRALDMTKTPP